MAHEYSRDNYPHRDDRGRPGGRPGGRGGYRDNQERRGIPLSDLDPTTTEASRKVIGCAIEVHRALGPGYAESVYVNAMKAELEGAGVKFENGRSFNVVYKERKIGEVSAGMLVEGRFIVDFMARPGPVGTPERMALRAQLKAADLELGLIINFADRRLKDGLVRVVNVDKFNLGKGENDEGADEGGDDRVHDFDSP